MKPIGKAQGKGIFLLNKLSQIAQWKTDYRWKPDNPSVESYVVQRYINNPYLVGGKKFDMRMYALVTSFQPLTVYIYRNGFARFSASCVFVSRIACDCRCSVSQLWWASSRYSNSSADIMNTFVHLTNVAIQKTSDQYNADVRAPVCFDQQCTPVSPSLLHSPQTGGKWDLRALKVYLISRFGHEAVDVLFHDMNGIMVRSLLAVQQIMINDKHCFELYGYDLLFDDQLKPWLIEVNASPSVRASRVCACMPTRCVTLPLPTADSQHKGGL